MKSLELRVPLVPLKNGSIKRIAREINIKEDQNKEKMKIKIFMNL